MCLLEALPQPCVHLLDVCLLEFPWEISSRHECLVRRIGENMTVGVFYVDISLYAILVDTCYNCVGNPCCPRRARPAHPDLPESSAFIYSLPQFPILFEARGACLRQRVLTYWCA